MDVLLWVPLQGETASNFILGALGYLKYFLLYKDHEDLLLAPCVKMSPAG